MEKFYCKNEDEWNKIKEKLLLNVEVENPEYYKPPVKFPCIVILAYSGAGYDEIDCVYL